MEEDEERRYFFITYRGRDHNNAIFYGDFTATFKGYPSRTAVISEMLYAKDNDHIIITSIEEWSKERYLAWDL